MESAEYRLESTFSYPKLAERLKERPSDKEKATKILKEMASEASIPALKNFQRFLDVTLPTLYDGVLFHPAPGMDFLELVKTHAVVLVPNHQSHADYIALNYSVFKRYTLPVYIAGGINLNIFPIGTLFRKSGCFFIRRSFNNDILYKLVLEGYLYSLLKDGLPIEFFFEGGRSRTGKLLPPRFGLYQMLLEAYQAIPLEQRKKIVFVPVSIVHEYLPEQRSLTHELEGGKKQKENTTQLLKLFNLFSKHFGSIHINLGQPITPQWEIVEKDPHELKKITQSLAFDCFRTVGANMVVTPTSLLAMALLDTPAGALSWKEIVQKAQSILDYCRRFHVPIGPSLEIGQMEASLSRGLEMLRGNGKLDLVGSGDQLFYSIKQDSRKELLYFKNTILHHFLVPWIIGRAWICLFRGDIVNVQDLKKFFLTQRSQLKYEFYLPTVKEFFFKALEIVGDCVGRPIKGLEECLELSHKELFAIAQKMGVFTRSYSYIQEAYYISALTVKIIGPEYKEGFKQDVFLKRAKEVFETEMAIGRSIRYPESFLIPLIKNGLEYLLHQKIVSDSTGPYKVLDTENLDLLIKVHEQDLKTNQGITLF